jgi:hypothetical protein
MSTSKIQDAVSASIFDTGVGYTTVSNESGKDWGIGANWTWIGPANGGNVAKKLTFKVDGKEISIETEKPFIKVSRLQQLAGVSGGLYRAGEDDEGEDVLKAVRLDGVVFPDGNEYFTESYVSED